MDLDPLEQLQITVWHRLRPPVRAVRPPQKIHKKYFSKATPEIPRTSKDECLTPPELRERSETLKIRFGANILTWSSPVAQP